MQEKVFEDDKGLACFCEEWVSGKKVAVVAGHFLLMYHPPDNGEGHKLIPAIWQDIPQDSEASSASRNFAKKMFGDFSVASFRFGLKLRCLLQRRRPPIDCRIALLVNDHKFSEPTFQPERQKSIQARTYNLRQAFFHLTLQIPDSYRKELEKAEMDASDAILQNVPIKRRQSGILPESCPFFSETQLRNRFKRNTLRMIRNSDRLEYSRSDSDDDSVLNVHYRRQNGSRCALTESGACGCSGEMVEFIMNLLDSDFSEIIAIIPAECIDAVKDAAAVAVEIASEIKGHALRVCIVAGFGGIGYHPEDVEKEGFVAYEFGSRPSEMSYHT
ncbi:hypothetical protein ACYFX5_26855 [Bremerella sp. T1]|uniref:hypothetical protein n=1 Tax=Bremerella sp. TYQ1 TaxID=3119568 RepID=UPI001CCBE9C5|nr:hypothetical protein [Bremerella volcania]UBM36630.1 hypothetical protein LA756_01710 [Bremerella volcania]